MQNTNLSDTQLIVNFLGWESHTDNMYDFPESFNVELAKKYDCIPLEMMEFHSNWNWLMKVVIAIEKMGFVIAITGISYKVYKVLDEQNPIVSLVCGDLSKKLELTYNTVVRFIKYYNEIEIIKEFITFDTDPEIALELIKNHENPYEALDWVEGITVIEKHEYSYIVQEILDMFS